MLVLFVSRILCSVMNLTIYWALGIQTRFSTQTGRNQMYQVGNKRQKNVFGALFLLPCYFIVLKEKTKKKPSPIKFPSGSPREQHSPLTKKKLGTVFERLGTPRSSRSCPPRKRNLNNKVGPWMHGCAPRDTNQRFLGGQTPSGTNPNIRPSGWYSNEEGQIGDEDKIGTAGTSEEENNE